MKSLYIDMADIANDQLDLLWKDIPWFSLVSILQ